MTSVYTFKASPYSSHSLLLAAFPREGHGRTVLDVGCGSGYLGASLAERGFAVTGIERPDGYSKPFPASVRLVEADLEHGLPDLVEGFRLCTLRRYSGAFAGPRPYAPPTP